MSLKAPYQNVKELEELLQPFWRSPRPALKTKLKPTSGSKCMLLCVGCTWTQAQVWKSTIVYLHWCRLLSGFSYLQSWAQHLHVLSPPGLTPCPLPLRLTLSHLPTHNSLGHALTQFPWARCALPPSPASQGKTGCFSRPTPMVATGLPAQHGCS